MATSKKQRLAKKQQARLLREVTKMAQIKGASIEDLMLDLVPSNKIRTQQENVQQQRKTKTNVSRETLPRANKIVQTNKPRKTRRKQIEKVTTNRKSFSVDNYIKKTRLKKPQVKKTAEEIHKARVEGGRKAYQTKIAKMTPEQLAEHNRRVGERLQEGKHKKKLAKQLEESGVDLFNVDIEIEDDFEVPKTSEAPIQDDIIDRIEEMFRDIEELSPLSKISRTTHKLQWLDITEFGLVSDFNDIVSEHELNNSLMSYVQWLYSEEEELKMLVDKILEAKYYEEGVEGLRVIYTIIQASPIDIETSMKIDYRQETINGV